MTTFYCEEGTNWFPFQPNIKDMNVKKLKTSKGGWLTNLRRKKIENLNDGPDRVGAIKRMAKAWGVDMKKVRDIWYNVHNAAGKKGPTTGLTRTSSGKVSVRALAAVKIKSVVAPSDPKDVKPFTLEEGAIIGTTSDTDKFRDSILPLAAKMDIYDPKGTRHTVPFPIGKRYAVLGWLRQIFPDREYGTVNIKDNKEYARLYRKK